MTLSRIEPLQLETMKQRVIDIFLIEAEFYRGSGYRSCQTSGQWTPCLNARKYKVQFIRI